MKTRSVFFSVVLFFFAVAGFAQKAKEKKQSKYDFQGEPFCGRARIKQDHKWGFIDRNGNIIVKPKYNEEENFKDGLAKVRKEHFWGLIDTTGKEVIPVAFDWVGDFEGDYAKVTTQGEKAYIDRTGKVVSKDKPPVPAKKP